MLVVEKASNGYGGQEFPDVFSADPRTREYSWTVRFSIYPKTQKPGELMVQLLIKANDLRTGGR